MATKKYFAGKSSCYKTNEYLVQNFSLYCGQNVLIFTPETQFTPMFHIVPPHIGFLAVTVRVVALRGTALRGTALRGTALRGTAPCTEAISPCVCSALAAP